MENQNITINMENLSQEERTALLSLIEKANKPKSKVWKPESDEMYYYSCSDGFIKEATWDNIMLIKIDTQLATALKQEKKLNLHWKDRK